LPFILKQKEDAEQISPDFWEKGIWIFWSHRSPKFYWTWELRRNKSRHASGYLKTGQFQIVLNEYEDLLHYASRYKTGIAGKKAFKNPAFHHYTLDWDGFPTMNWSEDWQKMRQAQRYSWSRVVDRRWFQLTFPGVIFTRRGGKKILEYRGLFASFLIRKVCDKRFGWYRMEAVGTYEKITKSEAYLGIKRFDHERRCMFIQRFFGGIDIVRVNPEGRWFYSNRNLGLIHYSLSEAFQEMLIMRPLRLFFNPANQSRSYCRGGVKEARTIPAFPFHRDFDVDRQSGWEYQNQ